MRANANRPAALRPRFGPGRLLNGWLLLRNLVPDTCAIVIYSHIIPKRFSIWSKVSFNVDKHRLTGFKTKLSVLGFIG